MANGETGNLFCSNSSFRILSISDDEGLRYSRELLLMNAGYETESVSSDAELSIARVRSFDAALICRSVDAKRGMALTEMLQRYNPEIQIMCIAPLESMEQLDIHLHIVPEPQLFLEAVKRLHLNAAGPKSCHAAH